MGLCHVVCKKAECWVVFGAFPGVQSKVNFFMMFFGVSVRDIWAATGDV